MALADTCEWKDKYEQIICALIFGANHRDAQRKALSKPKDIIDHFASFEAIDAYHKLLSANNSSHTTDVNRIKKTHHKKQIFFFYKLYKLLFLWQQPQIW